MAKKILVISDNPNIVRRFENEVWNKIDFSDFSLSYACSPYSNLDDFDLQNGIKHLNLKDQRDVDEILDNELIISIHCKQLFPKKLIDNVRCINVHPGYNPINRGWYPQVFSIIYNTEIGATIHEIDEKLDHGGIIAREKVKSFSYDTSLTLYNRVVNKEIDLLEKNLVYIINNDYNTFKPQITGNLYLKKDFKKVCKLNLDEKITMRDALNRLRALTHGNFKNAYFIDDDNNKIYVSLNINKSD